MISTFSVISASRLASLYLRRDKDADFSLICQDTIIAAHSFLLASTSEYFEMALSKDWMEKKEKRMELKDCSAEALNVAVNFMYGINIPEDFTKHGELLHLADLFMMDKLKEVVVDRLKDALTKANYLETCQIAELYNITRLINHCAHFVYEEMSDSDEIDWKQMGKLPTVMAAFGKCAMKGKIDSVLLKALKKREDFESDYLYGEFVRGSVNKGSIVRLLEDHGDYKKGHLGIVDSKDSSDILTILFSGMPKYTFGFKVEVLVPVTEIQSE